MGIRTVLAAVAATTLFAGAAEAQIFGATLPQARAGIPGQARTAFASISNTGAGAATDCRPALSASNTAPVTFSYQTTDASNVPSGTANTAATIAAGATQSYVFAVTPTATYSGSIPISFVCNGLTAPLSVAVNDFNLISSASQGADIIPIAVTFSGDGVVRIGAVGGTQIMVAAAVNIGPTADITVIPTTPNGIGLAADLSVIETTSLGAQIGTPQSSLTLSFVTNTPRYFTVIATANAGAGVPFQPDTTRIVLRFTDANGGIRGQTSAAIAAPSPPAPDVPLGFFPTLLRYNESVGGAPASELGVFVVTSPTEMWFFRSTPYNATQGHIDVDQVIIKFTNVNFTGGPNGTFTASSPSVYVADSGGGGEERIDGSVAISGSFTSLAGLSFAFSRIPDPTAGQPFNGTGTGNYGPLNFRNASLADIAGNWTIQDSTATTAAEVNQGTATISATGVISGTGVAGGCTLAGQLSDPLTKPDILTITSLSLSGASCPADTLQTDTGIMFKLPTGARPIHPAIGGTVGDYYAMLLLRNDGSDAAFIFLRRQ